MADSKITKTVLADAMKALMQEKPFEKISVTDICEKCGMNRKSFYYHFQDKYDLLNWIFYVGFAESIDMDSFEVSTEEELMEQFWKQIELITDYLYEERDFYSKALRVEGQNSFKDYFRDNAVPVLYFFLSDILEAGQYGDMFVLAICDAFIDILVRWLTDANPIGPKELRESFRDMIIKIAGKITESVQ